MGLNKKTWISTLFLKQKILSSIKNSATVSLIKPFKRFLKIKFPRMISFLFDFYGIFLRPQMGYSCRFHPTCSSYVRESFQTLGFLKGLVFSLKRIIRCHPFSKGGFDPVPERKTDFYGR